MKKVLLALFLICLSKVYAFDIIPSNSNYYYKLNGGSDLSMPPVTNHDDLTVGGDVNANLGYTCDGFNPSISIRNEFNDIKDSLQSLSQDILNSATAAVGTMPLYIIEKANKDLYNFFQNTLSDGKDRFRFSLSSCQQDLDKISQDKSPYQDWFSVSDSQGWLNYARGAEQGQDVDINRAKTEIAKDPKKYGIPWTHKGQNSGGSVGNQMPIEVIADVVQAGYNVMIDPARALDSNSSASSDSELAKFWKTPQNARDWSQLVLGDITISANSDQKTHAGVGLVTLLRTCPSKANNELTCVKTVQQNLANVVTSGDYPSAADLQKISSGQMMITPQVIAAIRNMSIQDQAVTVSKLGEDVALQNLVNESLLLRRLLIAGSETQPVHNLNSATKTIQNTIQILDKDIQNLLFEYNIKKTMTTSTVQTVLGTSNTQELNALSQHEKTQEPVMQHGATYKDKN